MLDRCRTLHRLDLTRRSPTRASAPTGPLASLLPRGQNYYYGSAGFTQQVRAERRHVHLCRPSPHRRQPVQAAQQRRKGDLQLGRQGLLPPQGMYVHGHVLCRGDSKSVELRAVCVFLCHVYK